MSPNLKPYFDQYAALLLLADTTFDKMKAEYADGVRCRLACSDCCYALFDLYLVEALYVNQRFKECVAAKRRESILAEADRIDRRIHKLKREAHRRHHAGDTQASILHRMANERIKCPLLNANDECELYPHRPLTCRFYGIPTEIAGRGYTCGKSGFVKGKAYPTVHLDVIHQKLLQLSNQIVRDLASKYVRMGEMLVPLSMALLTEYDAEYLGIKPMPTEKEVPATTDE